MSHSESESPGNDELDTEFDEWLDRDDEPDDAAAPARGVTMRHPTMLVMVLACSAFVAFQASKDLRERLGQRDTVDCGDLGERPHLKAASPGQVPPLPHGRWCTLRGIVSSPVTLVSGEPAETNNPYKKYAKLKFFVRLAGERVWAVVPGDNWDANNHRIKKGSLFGFEVRGVGHIQDPDKVGKLRQTAERLRLKWGAAKDAEMRIFDLTDEPEPLWQPIAVLVIAAVATLLACFGLLRIALRRRDDASIEAPA